MHVFDVCRMKCSPQLLVRERDIDKSEEIKPFKMRFGKKKKVLNSLKFHFIFFSVGTYQTWPLIHIIL